MSVVTYEEVLDLPNNPEVLLIDVRDPPEIKDTGSIPTSINIPRKFIAAFLFFRLATNLHFAHEFTAIISIA